MARLLQVIETEAHRGTGTGEDPHRSIRQFFSTDGELLIERDDWRESNRAGIAMNAYVAVDYLCKVLSVAEPNIDKARRFADAARLLLEGKKVVIDAE